MMPQKSPTSTSRYACLNPDERLQILDFDNVENLEKLTKKLDSEHSKNFLLDFGLDEAWCGFDLEAATWQKLLQARTVKADSRWIQIWRPYEHEVLITDLARRYDLSPRLTRLMLTKPHGSEPDRTKVGTPHTHRFQPWRSPKAPFASTMSSSDEEHGPVTDDGILVNEDIPLPDRAVRSMPKPIDQLDHYDIAESIW